MELENQVSISRQRWAPPPPPSKQTCSTVSLRRTWTVGCSTSPVETVGLLSDSSKTYRTGEVRYKSAWRSHTRHRGERSWAAGTITAVQVRIRDRGCMSQVQGVQAHFLLPFACVRGIRLHLLPSLRPHYLGRWSVSLLCIGSSGRLLSGSYKRGGKAPESWSQNYLPTSSSSFRLGPHHTSQLSIIKTRQLAV